MTLEIAQDRQGLARQADQWFRAQALAGARSAFLPAGGTPVPLYELWESERPNYLQRMQLIQIDEITSGSKSGEFRRFFEQHLPSYAGRILSPESNVSNIDLAYLGIGTNGHVGFHEPGLPYNMYQACVELAPETIRRLKLEPKTRAISFGAGAFFQCRAVLMMAFSSEKREILQSIRGGQDTSPAAHLIYRHPRLTLLVDEEAYGASQSQKSSGPGLTPFA